MAKPFDNYGKAKNFAERLQNLIKAWKTISEPALEHRKQLLKLRASGYFDKQYNKWHSINLIDRGVSTIVPFLVEGNPKLRVDTRIQNYRPMAVKAQLGLNYLIDKMRFAQEVLIPAAINSMFGAGITRTDFYYDRIISLEDEVIKLGTPKVELIDDSNYIGDPSAKRRSDFVFEGDLYTLPTEYARDFFGPKFADIITPDSKLTEEYSPIDIMAPDFDRTLLSLRDYTTFADVYLRDEGTIITIMPYGKKPKILKTKDWEGPGDGPYDYIGYHFMPEFPIPIPPAWFWHDMDVSVNVIVNKLRELVENQKDIIIYTDDNVEEAKRILDTPNIGSARANTTDGISSMSLGGIKDNSNWDMVRFLIEEQTKTGANPDVLAGRGTQAPTFGQEQMLYQNASRVVNNMNSRFQDFTVSIVRKLAWAFWTDPTLEVPVVKDIPNYGQLPAVFSSADKVGDFYDFVFEIIPYSTQRMNPEMSYQKTMMFLTQWVLPTLPMAMQQGATIDVPTVTKMLAEDAGIKNFGQYYRTVVPQGGDVNLSYQMQPNKNRKQGGKGGQASDAFGTTLGNQLANFNQEQTREKETTNEK